MRVMTSTRVTSSRATKRTRGSLTTTTMMMTAASSSSSDSGKYRHALSSSEWGARLKRRSAWDGQLNSSSRTARRRGRRSAMLMLLLMMMTERVCEWEEDDALP